MRVCICTHTHLGTQADRHVRPQARTHTRTRGCRPGRPRQPPSIRTLTYTTTATPTRTHRPTHQETEIHVCMHACMYVCAHVCMYVSMSPCNSASMQVPVESTSLYKMTPHGSSRRLQSCNAGHFELSEAQKAQSDPLCNFLLQEF